MTKKSLNNEHIPFLSREDFNWVQKAVPMICVDVIVKDNDKILLGKRNTYPFKGLWHIPGGLIYYNESIRDAINRISYRETGLEVEIVKQIPLHEYINEDPRGHFIGLNYIVKKIGGEIKTNECNSDLQYFNNVPYDTNPCQINIIKDILNENNVLDGK